MNGGSERPVAEGTAACPWCSAPLTGRPAACPSCGAALAADPDLQVPGLTTVAGEGRPRRRPRRGFVGLLLGGTEPDDDASPRA